jgi:hypothetical protein
VSFDFDQPHQVMELNEDLSNSTMEASALSGLRLFEWRQLIVYYRNVCRLFPTAGGEGGGRKTAQAWSPHPGPCSSRCELSGEKYGVHISAWNTVWQWHRVARRTGIVTLKVFQVWEH